MTMYIEAEKLNPKLKSFTQEQLEALVRFGQVAKFRCRSNTAYRNFVEACLRDIAQVTTETIKNDNDEYTKLIVRKVI